MTGGDILSGMIVEEIFSLPLSLLCFEVSDVSDSFFSCCWSAVEVETERNIRYFVRESYREILLSLQLVPELLQLDTHIVIVPGTAPTICQSLLLPLLANDPSEQPSAVLSNPI